MRQFNSIAIEQYNNKKIALGDNLKVRFSVVRKGLYTFLHHEKTILLTKWDPIVTKEKKVRLCTTLSLLMLM